MLKGDSSPNNPACTIAPMGAVPSKLMEGRNLVSGWQCCAAALTEHNKKNNKNRMVNNPKDEG